MYNRGLTIEFPSLMVFDRPFSESRTTLAENFELGVRIAKKALAGTDFQIALCLKVHTLSIMLVRPNA